MQIMNHLYVTSKVMILFLICFQFTTKSDSINSQNINPKLCNTTTVNNVENYGSTIYPKNMNLPNVPMFLGDIAYNINNASVTSSEIHNFTLFNSVYINKNAANGNQVLLPTASVSSVVSTTQNILKNSIELQSVSSKNSLSNINRKDIGGGLKSNVISEFVKNFDLRLKIFRNVELGVAYIQQMFDTMDSSQIVQNDTEIVAKISLRITNKIQRALNSINYLHSEFLNEITQLQIDHKKNINDKLYLNTIIQSCPFNGFSLEQNYDKKQIEIVNYLKHEKHAHHNDESTLNFTINSKIMNELRRMQSNENTFKHVYFLSRSDHASDNHCQYYYNDQHFRHLYVSSILHKHVFLLVDNGNAFNDEHFELIRFFVTNIIQLLADDDYLTIVLVSDKATPIKLKDDDNVNSLFMYLCTMDNRKEFLDYINQLSYLKNVSTNHTVGFEYSFELLQKHNLSMNVPVEFLYITRGLLSRLTDAMNVLLAISKGQKLLRFPIKINTCAVVIDERRIMYEKQFLRDIAKQNFSKYEIDVSDWYNSTRATEYDIIGNMYIITKRHPEGLIKTSCAVFETIFLEKFIKDQIKFHQPVLDYNTIDFIVSITRPIRNYGVIGVNMFLNDLIEDVIYFNKYKDSYAFMMDINGIVISHPAYMRPIATFRNNFPVDIAYLETANEDFYKIRWKILNESNGNVTLFNKNRTQTISYTWKRILNAYIVCIVSIGNKKPVIQLSWPSKNSYYQRNVFSSLDLLYHRIDLIPPQSNSLCRHFRQIATLDSETVFLSASSFQSPFAYLRNNKECKDDVRIHNSISIMAYIKDVTNLLANPGLLPSVRSDVTALCGVMSHLKKRHQESDAMKKYIIRRYVATVDGVILLYPGSVLGIDLEPSRRPWFRKAMKFPGKIVLTEPYLDAGGAGYIVTIAHTIFESKTSGFHDTTRDRSIAVIAVDVPYGYFYKIVLDSSGFCSKNNIKCILIEDEGYVIAHPSILEPVAHIRNDRGPLEHITQKESFVANDMLNHKQLVIKKLCATYQNRKIQRYYEFNISITETLTNFVYGERTRYQIKAIYGTNIFAIVLNTTCNGGAFCPCSTIDRVCLNCNRMDQTDCECPCECPLKVTSIDEKPEQVISYCEPPSESFEVVNSLSYDWNMVLKSCSSINCDLFSTQLDCLGVMGCEWCQLDIDGNPFPTPFCTTQSSCFNGVLGSVTPYGDGELGSVIPESTMPSVYSAIGPVGGAIIALCLVVGFAIYCYRQNMENVSNQLFADSVQEENFGVQLSRFNFNDILQHEDGDLGGNNDIANMHRNLANAIAITDISPYHMSTDGYKRRNGESDHGYSTMTPHEDSEHMCFTLVEPLINSKQCHLLSTDSISVNTLASSTFNQERGSIMSESINTKSLRTKEKLMHDNCESVKPGKIISPHHILAPVTVHRQMEAS